MKFGPKILIGSVIIGVILIVILERFSSDPSESLENSSKHASISQVNYSSDQQDRLIRDLQKQVADLEGRLQQAQNKEKLAKTEFDLDREEVNTETSEKILFPSNPTKENLNAYVQAILETSKNQKSFSVRDPRIEMLKKVGKENLDILVSYLEKGFSSPFLIWAIEGLATKQDKDLILNAIPNHNKLISIAYKYGWQNDIKDLIINNLNKNIFMEGDWLEAAASLGDTKANEALIHHFMNSDYPIMAYKVISRIPEIKLTDEQISKAWENRGSDDVFNSLEFAGIAANHGQIDALGFLIKNLNHPTLNSRFGDYRKKEMSEDIYQMTGMSGSPEVLQQWYEQAKGRLVFNPSTHHFEVK